MESSTSATFLNLADVIAGRAKVKQTAIPNPIWVKIIEQALADLRPRLEYLTGFTEPKKQLSRKAEVRLRDPHFTHHSFHTDDASVTGVFPEFESGVRWAEVARLALFSDMVLGSPEEGEPYFYEHRLHLTTKGDFYTWFARCQRKKAGQYNPEMWIQHFEVKKVELFQLALNEIQYPRPDHTTQCLGSEILHQTGILLRQTIKQREGYLGEMAHALETLTAPSKWIEI